MRFTKIPASTFDELQVNAGVIAKAFDPTTGTLNEADIVTATSGGITINAKPSFEDFGSDIDNCPKNTKELKRKTDMEVTVSCTALNINSDTLKMMLAAADVDSTTGAIVSRTDLKLADFSTLWWIGDLSNGGFIAVKLIDALSTDGFSLKTSDKGKGNLSLTLTAHASINSQDVEPVEFYLGEGESDAVYIRLSVGQVSLVDGDTHTVTATATTGASITWASTNTSVATVSDGVITAEGEGVCAITAIATKDGESAIASVNVTVSAAEQGEG